MPKEVRNDMDFKRVDMRKSELHRHMEQEKKLKDAIAFDDCPCIYTCCKLDRKCCGQGYCDEQVTVEEICLRNQRFKQVFDGLGELLKVHKEEKDTEHIPEIIGKITGLIILIQTDIDGYSDHLKENKKD